MNDLDLLEELKSLILNGERTNIEQWKKIFKDYELVGNSDAETIVKVQNFIKDHFSFEIKNAKSAYVYFGSDGSYNVWEIVKGMCKDTSEQIYISSTEAGKLFNDDSFNLALKSVLENNEFNSISELYDGYEASGFMDFTTSDGQKIQSFNDFFSKNYIDNLKCSDVKVVFSGDNLVRNGEGLNAFCRTEFEAILDNNSISTINGIDKNVLFELYTASPSHEDGMNYVCDVLKQSEVSSLQNVYYKMGNEGISIVNKDTEGAVKLIDNMIANNKLSPSNGLAKMLENCGKDLSEETKNAIKNIYKENNETLLKIIENDADNIMKISKAESVRAGEFVLRKEGTIVQTLSNGSVVEYSKNSKLAEEILESGKSVKGTNGKLHLLNNEGSVTLSFAEKTIKFINAADVAGTILEFANQYKNGNKETAVKGLTAYAVSSIRSFYDAELFKLAAVAFCGVFSVEISLPVLAFAEIAGSICGSIWGEDDGNSIGDLICCLFGFEDESYDSAEGAVRYVADPLVLDMDGDGFETLSVGNGVYFDEDATGLAEKTAWVSGDDALLAVDLNGNGKIDDGSELFGTATVLGNGEKAESGFAALMQYDSNGDGVIDESDEMYARLMIWQDKNSDGESQNGELVLLKDAGIVSISLETDEESGRNVSVVTFTDGTTRKLGEFDFDAQYYNTVEKEETVISAAIQALPDIQAIGSVESLHTLMQKDESGMLKGYVEKFQSAQTTEEREDLVTKILYFVTGAAQVDAGSRGSEMDAQKLMVVEKFMGRDFVGTQGANPVNTAASILNNMYAEIFQAYYSLLNAQSHLSNYVKMTCIMEQEDGTKVINTEMFDAFIKLCRENGADMTEQVAEMGRYIRYMNFENQDNFHSYLKNYEVDDTYLRSIVETCYPSAYYGTDTANTYSGSDADEAFMAGAGDDVIYARTGNDIIYGEAGNDNIYAENGDDIIVGGTGNDDLNGGYGNDTYIFHKGDGADTIIDYEYSTTAGKDDKIIFGEGILPEDVTMERIGDDLLIQYGEGDQITVRDAYYYSDGRYQIESMVFADGTVWKQEDIAVRCNTRHGSDGNDTMSTYSTMLEYDDNETFYAGAGNDTVYAGDGKDMIYAGTGDDTIYGGSGDDVIDGGTGNDDLNGGYGNDTYIFHKGDGADIIIDYEYSTTAGKDDKIIFGEGILPEDVTMERIGDDLLIQYGEGDQITVRDAYYYSDGRYQVESMVFSDQSKYNINYSDTELVLVKAGIQNQAELITDVSEETSVDEMVTSISDISQENALINAEDGIITDSADILVEGMANLAVQELSEVSTENVSEASNFANVVVQDDNVQLWVE